MAHTPTIAARALKKLLEVGPELGVEADAAFRQVGFDRAAWDDPDARVPISTLHAIWEIVVARAARPDCALVTARHYVPGDYDLVGFVCMNAATLRAALAHVIRYSRLWADEPTFEFASSCNLRLGYRHVFADRPGLWTANEAGLAEILHAARLVMQTHIEPTAVRMTHPAPTDTRAHTAFFGVPVEFGAMHNELVFSEEQLDAAVPRADEQLGAYLRTLANEALARRGDPDSLMERLRHGIAEGLLNGVPELPELAKKLGMSERSLRRRLEELGTSFRDVLDAVRKELALNHLKDRRLPLSEVAFMLGFSEPSTFHRAFKRWTGETPAAYRSLRT